MPTSTSRLSLQQPIGTDPVSEIRTAVNTNASVLDASVTFLSGTLAAIPAASLAGRRYFATDAGIELWDTGTAWIPTGPTPPVGAMMQWSLNSDPVDPDGVSRWIISDGRAISRTTYATLNSHYSAAGYPWGNGNGSTTFNVPDTRQRFPLGKAASGTGSTFATTGGAVDHTHTVNSHSHPLSSNGQARISAADTSGQIISVFWDAGSGQRMSSSGFTYVQATGSSSPLAVSSGVTAGSNLETSMLQGTTDNAAPGTGTNNPPYIVVNHIIRVL